MENENIKNDNKVIDKFGSRTYKEILKNAKVIGSKLGSFVKNNDPVPVYMEKSKVEFVYKNISSLNKISIVNKKIFRILPYICVPSLAIGGIAVFLKEMKAILMHLIQDTAQHRYLRD